MKLPFIPIILFPLQALAVSDHELVTLFKPYCEQNKAVHLIDQSHYCQLARGEIHIKEICETYKSNSVTARQMRFISDKYADMKGILASTAPEVLCAESSAVQAATPECQDEVSGKKKVDRVWWNSDKWEKTNQSLQEIKAKAEAGDATAQFNLGNWFVDGAACIPQNRKLGVQYLCKSYDQNFEMAGHKIKGMRNFPTARIAREDIGKEFGCELTGHQKAYAEETKKYEIEAKAQLKKAEAGDARAMYKVGSLYLSDDYGLKQDYKAAFGWFERAAKKGHAGAMGSLAGMYNRGDGVEKDQTKAFEWTKKAVEHGDADSMVFLGDLYYHGQGVTEDIGKAVRLYAKAMDRGNADGKERLVEMYKRGELQAVAYKALANRIKALSTTQ